MCRVVLRRAAPALWLTRAMGGATVAAVMVMMAVAVVALAAAPAAAALEPAPAAPAALVPPVSVNVWRSGDIRLELRWAEGGQFGAALAMDSLSLMVGTRFGAIELIGGVASFKWGPGRNGSLMLSGAADPMPVAGYRLEEERADYIRFAGLMERDGNRVLIGHRLNYQPTPWLRVGISETAVLSGDPSALFYFPFPGLPMYALQHVAYQHDSRRGNDANVSIGADLVLEFGGTEVYGELLIDDAQGTLSSRDHVPDFIGVLGGLEVQRAMGEWIVTGNAEYTRINNYVYSHRVPDNCYTYHEVGLGHPLGPDADAVVLTVRAEAPGVVGEFKASYERHGEGHIGSPWRSEFGKDYVFLSGVVEKIARLELAVERRITGGVWVTAGAGLVRAENRGNAEGADWSGWRAGLGLKLAL